MTSAESGASSGSTRSHDTRASGASGDTDASNAKRIFILGATGSIGMSAVSVLTEFAADPDRPTFDVVGVSGGSRADALAEVAETLGAAHVALESPAADHSNHATHATWITGTNASARMIEQHARRGDLVLLSVVGAAGLDAAMAAIDAGCDIALANKETLVAGGSVVMPHAEQAGVKLYPVDSEHNALAQCLRAGRGLCEVRRLVLTASGGPFRTWSREKIESATLDAALAHPTWSMGAKVSIDSASLMNKGLELIEAHHLFGVEAERLAVMVHPQSIVHSLVEFIDGSVIAQLGAPDMRGPIQSALTWPDRHSAAGHAIDWNTFRRLDFEPVDPTQFKAPDIALEVIRRGGDTGTAFNAANEIAVDRFRAGDLPFGAIERLVASIVTDWQTSTPRDLADIKEADVKARRVASAWSPNESRRSIASP